jgi:hypothetical protein
MVNFDITAADVSEMKVTMYDVAGKIIIPSFASTTLNKGNNKLTVDIDNVPAGSYVLRIQIGAKAFIKKLSIID